MPALARYGLEHGLDHFCMWDMPFLGFYLKAGKGSLFDNPPERQSELRRVLAEARELGVETNALINLRLVEAKNNAWRERGEDRMIRSRYGLAIHESYPLRANSGTQHSAYLESGGVRLCQSYSVFQNTQVCNLWWHWDWNGLRPEVFRYLLPASIQSWTIDAFEHEHEVGRAFALGHLLNINVRSFELALPDAPVFAARIKQLTALRKKTAKFTVDARFQTS